MFQPTADAALLSLLEALEGRGYDFVTPLNDTLRTVRARPDKQRARDLRDALGWSLPFTSGDLEPEIEALLLAAGVLEEDAQGFKATVRVSRVQDALFLHSAFPTTAKDSVFLGPDSYRFAEFLRIELAGGPAGRSIWDIGTGAGVGGVVAGRLTGAADICLSDVNPKALQFARVNGAHAGLQTRVVEGDGLAGCGAAPDLIIANPPFIAGSDRTYSDGGEMHGARLSLDWAIQGMERLAPGGRLLLYTGSAIVAGRDPLREALVEAAAARDCTLSYRELDPDIFGKELLRPEYADVERIAAIGAVATLKP